MSDPLDQPAVADGVTRMVGARVRQLRERAQLTQEALGEQIGTLLGRSWTRQAVSMAEQGGRSWPARELVAAAQVLGVEPGMLLRAALCERCLDRPPVGYLCRHCMADGGAA